MNYELVCILSPKITDKEIDGEIEKIDNVLSEAEVVNLEKSIWGKKELAYPIEKFMDGYYVQYNFELIPENVDKINKKLKLENSIIRFLIMKQDKIKEEVKETKKEKKDIDKKENKAKKDDKKEEDKVKENKEEKTELKKDNKKEDFDKKLDEVLDKDLTV